MDHIITAVRNEPDGWTVEYFAEDDTERVRGCGHSIPHAAVEGRMAEYGLSSPAEALDLLLHESLWSRISTADDPRDDPATAAGWVTATEPDAEPVTVYTARSTGDARGAHLARIGACKARERVTDPDRLLPTPKVHRGRLQSMREHVDTARWERVYGRLPVLPGGSLGPPVSPW